MKNSLQSSKAPTNRCHLHLLESSQSTNSERVARWRINGFAAIVIVWTKEEWSRLTDRPTDAQSLPGGQWCALRIE
jgi:hypothetical protein